MFSPPPQAEQTRPAAPTARGRGPGQSSAGHWTQRVEVSAACRSRTAAFRVNAGWREGTGGNEDRGWWVELEGSQC